MAKDPAFLFYSSDFLTGTTFMSFEDKGKFIIILCQMHQHGHLSEESIRLLVGSPSVTLKSKFIIEGNIWRNKRLDEEIEKRKKFVDSRQNNGKLGGRPKAKGKPKNNRKVNLPVNEDVNEDVNKNTNTIFTRCRTFYFEWYEKRFKLKPDFDGSDGIALKNIIAYFNLQKDNAGDEKVYLTWTTMLTNFDKWDKFHQGQTRIRQINSNKSNIINTLKNGKAGSITPNSIADAMEKRFAEKHSTPSL